MNVHPLNAAPADKTARQGWVAKVVVIVLIVATLVAINALVIG